MERRRIAVMLLVLLAAAALIARLAWIQVVHRDWFMERLLAQRVNAIEVPVRRGDILDRNGEVLATSLLKTTVFVDPRDADPAKTAAVLAPILGKSEAELREAIARHPTYVEVARGLDAELADRIAAAIREHDLRGVGYFQEPVRHYPLGDLAAHVIGFVGERPDRPRDQVGLGGVELYYDEYLHGQNGWVIAERDPTQQEIPGAARLEVSGVDGDHVRLTLDARIQRIVEEELERQLVETRAKRGVVIVMEPHTGEILALASLPAFDPAQVSEADPDRLFNLAVSGTYEPGSSWKALTVAIAYEEGLIADGEQVYCAPSVTIRDGDVAEATIRDWQPGGAGWQTPEGVLGFSCNPGTIAIGMRIDPDTLRRYMEQLGIINPEGVLATGVDLPGEGKELIQPPEHFRSNISRATMTIGQGFAVTPLQMLTAFATLANDGYLVKPHVVKEIIAPDGTVRYQADTAPRRRVFNLETVQKVRRGLEYAVENGTAGLARVPGYRVGGKTATAEKVVPDAGGYAPGKYYAAFIGMAPMGDPAVVILVLLDEPATHSGYGGMNAAPLFSRIAGRILPLLAAAPDSAPEGSWVEIRVPDVRGELLRKAEAVLRRHDPALRFRVSGDGEWVQDQEVVEENGAPVVLLHAATLRDPEGYWRVPDLTGMTPAEAETLLGGLRIRAYGSGSIAGQSIAPGTRVPEGTPLVLWAQEHH